MQNSNDETAADWASTNTSAQTESQAALQIERNRSIADEPRRFDKKEHVLPQIAGHR